MYVKILKYAAVLPLLTVLLLLSDLFVTPEVYFATIVSKSVTDAGKLSVFIPGGKLYYLNLGNYSTTVNKEIFDKYAVGDELLISVGRNSDQVLTIRKSGESHYSNDAVGMTLFLIVYCILLSLVYVLKETTISSFGYSLWIFIVVAIFSGYFFFVKLSLVWMGVYDKF